MDSDDLCVTQESIRPGNEDTWCTALFAGSTAPATATTIDMAPRCGIQCHWQPLLRTGIFMDCWVRPKKIYITPLSDLELPFLGVLNGQSSTCWELWPTTTSSSQFVPQITSCGGFHKWGEPLNGWSTIVYNWKTIQNGMIFQSSPILGNLHMAMSHNSVPLILDDWSRLVTVLPCSCLIFWFIAISGGSETGRFPNTPGDGWPWLSIENYGELEIPHVKKPSIWISKS